jgi:phage/plasmid-like protein (TIGR03299 family)
MAHELRSSKDIAFAGKTPWHGLGTRLLPSDTLDQWRVAAGLDWVADRRQAYFSTRTAEGRNVPTPIKDRWALVRSDTQEPLGLVSTRYQIVQPKEVMEFYRDLTDSLDFQMETAGCLAGGARIWALAKTPNTMRIKGQDQVDGYLLLATSFDGTMATTAQFTSVRVVCQNTLSLSLSNNRSNKISIAHKARFDENQVKYQLGIYGDAWGNFEEQVNHLAEKRVGEVEVVEYLRQVLPDSTQPVVKAGRVVLPPTYKKIISLFAGGMGQELRSANQTYWGLVNAVTEYYDHHAKAAKKGGRLDSAWFGRGAATKQRAFETALEMADAA